MTQLRNRQGIDYKMVAVTDDETPNTKVRELLLEGWQLHGGALTLNGEIYQPMVLVENAEQDFQILFAISIDLLQSQICTAIDDGWQTSGEMLFADGLYVQKMTHEEYQTRIVMYKHADGKSYPYAETLKQWERPANKAEFRDWFNNLPPIAPRGYK